MGVTRKRYRLGGLILALALAFTGGAEGGECPLANPAPGRVVAVGDVHGELGGLVSILIASGLIGPDLHWIGGDTTLVQTGDLLDRGPQVREVMDLLIRLQHESEAAGGRVICLMGNHEAMNLLGVLEEVSAECYAQFVGPGSESRLKSAWKDQVRLWRRLAAAERRVVVDIPDETRTKWHRRFPPGSLEYLEALSPEGKYGRWLRSLPVAVVLGDTLFVHGGLTPSLQGLDVEALNRRAAAELAAFDTARKALVERELALPWSSLLELDVIARDELERLSSESGERHRSDPELAAYASALQGVGEWGSWHLVSDDGPLCTRAASDWDETEHRDEMLALIAGFGVSRMVVGHSPRSSASIEPRFDGRVLLIDTGMLARHYHGRPSALEICGDRLTAIYPNERRPLAAAQKDQVAGPDVGVAPGGALPSQPDLQPLPAGPVRHHRWLDIAGAPLPFQEDREIEDFLATAEVVAQQEIPVGVTEPIKVVLEKDGVRAHAVFKDVDERQGFAGLRVDGQERVFRDFRDSHLHECAAYRLARLLGLAQIPPAVPREIGGRPGTLVLWLEDTISFTERKERRLEPPDPARLAQQLQMMLVFDNIAGNTDGSNLGNALIDRDWNLFFIDCSRCFVTAPEPLTLGSLERCERRLWSSLNRVTAEDLRGALGELLNRSQLDALVKRKSAVVEHIAGLIERRGEPAVLFDLELPNGEPDR